MRVLIGCEYSGIVRDAFRAKGHHAVSCDFLPTERPGVHYQGDVLNLLDGWEPVQFSADEFCQTSAVDISECGCIGPTMDECEYKEIDGVMLGRPIEQPHWDLAVFHPPCTYLAVSGLHWNKRTPGRAEKTEESIEFVKRLLDAPIERIALENPVGCISTRIRKPDQTIQPWWFGHDASKATCLWLKNLPALQPTNMLPGDKKTRRANQTPSGQNKLGPSADRWKLRSETYPGIAAAMAEQWSNLLL